MITKSYFQSLLAQLFFGIESVALHSEYAFTYDIQPLLTFWPSIQASFHFVENRLINVKKLYTRLAI